MSETDTIRTLEEQLNSLTQHSAGHRGQKIDLLNALAWQLSDIDAKRAYALSEEAYALACEPDGSTSRQTAMARSLRTLGYINQRLGNHPLGLRQLLEALALCEAQSITDALPDVLDGIAGIYFQIGDYPTALDYIHRQLVAAQHSGDERQQSNALNNLAVLYWQTNDRIRAVETLQRNLQLANDIGFERIRAISLMNLAEAYSDAGETDLARDCVQQSLQISQAAGFTIFELHAHHIAGAIELQGGDGNTALDILNYALTLCRTENIKVVEVQLLTTLGEAYVDLQRVESALEVLHQALVIATELDAKDAMSNVHQRLADGYEKMGDAARALLHLRQYQTLKEVVAGEKAEQRLQVLRVAHDTATAQQEAENAHLRTVELSALNEHLEQQVAIRTAELTKTVAQLQTEVAMREEAEAGIRQLVATLEQRVAARTDELATFFDLTLVAGQAVDLQEIFTQLLARIMEITHSRALCIHLFDAERTSLGLAGQQQLPDQARAVMQTLPLRADFARWMQQPHDPLVTTDLPMLGLLPAALRPPEYRSYLGAQIKIGGRLEGLLSCYRFTDRGFSIDEIALVTALAEQLGMMLELQRLRQHAEAMAVVEERQRLARDLHDSVTQSLYSLSLFSRAGREAAEDGDVARLQFSLAELERNTLHALREMRLLLYALRPADLEREGLQRAIQLRLDSVERRVGLHLEVRMDELPSMPPASEQELYHIIVEALNNVVKHAAATRLGVDLTARDGSLCLCIVDDGRGFEPTQPAGGHGLRNIQERVARLRGRIEIASAPGRGTRLEATFPVAEEGSWRPS